MVVCMAKSAKMAELQASMGISFRGYNACSLTLTFFVVVSAHAGDNRGVRRVFGCVFKFVCLSSRLSAL